MFLAGDTAFPLNSPATSVVTNRDFWAKAGRHHPLRAKIWKPSGAHVGRTMCGFYSAARTEGGRPFPTPRPGEPRQRITGCLRLWGEAIVRQVR